MKRVYLVYILRIYRRSHWRESSTTNNAMDDSFRWLFIVVVVVAGCRCRCYWCWWWWWCCVLRLAVAGIFIVVSLSCASLLWAAVCCARCVRIVCLGDVVDLSFFFFFILYLCFEQKNCLRYFTSALTSWTHTRTQTCALQIMNGEINAEREVADEKKVERIQCQW